ncbi:XRE family transcriptional regulator [Saccharophagus sp. K07]|jgi:transcriptional regulator with XRE-family HTH domain|uniref:helix-turn-helix domain-containing protein n=1 Tax=Saccharophagus sp. K07 TaxID=2283636 RepID=UPI0016522E01|nr:helix-turn-helix transcriptional regulator [Saccharophagus sp. K07]MBC6904314.1 XRE family transcriptional regulator [Saccharophagus sp. K07]
MAKPLVDELDRHIGQRLKKLRQREGISAQALAEAIESTQQQISRYENGHNKLSATQLYRIACALGVPVSWFYQDFTPSVQVRNLAEEPASYEKAQISEGLASVSQLWPRLNAEQRAAVLRVIDAFLI